MDLKILIDQFVAGITRGAWLVLIASGLTLTFGVLRMLNFAHGTFYLLGAYLSYSLSRSMVTMSGHFEISLVVGPIILALIGGSLEVILIRRVYLREHLYQFLLMFAFVYLLSDAIRMVWGTMFLNIGRPKYLLVPISLLGINIPSYSVFIILLASLAVTFLVFLLYKTRYGMVVRAIAQDPEMGAALGVDVAKIRTLVFMIGCWLAGLAGVVTAGMSSFTLGMDAEAVILAFVVIVIGGMGSLLGAVLGGLIVGLCESFAVLFLPKLAIAVVYIVMSIVLVIRPWGLRGSPITTGSTFEGKEGMREVRRLDGLMLGRWRLSHILLSIVLLILIVLPVFASRFALLLSTEIFILSLFALSFYVLLGYGGMLSFGHAAYYGIGAYTCALLLTKAQLPVGLGILIAPLVASLSGIIIGWFCIRLTRLYFAMLTMAFSQLVWAVVFKSRFTGAGDGIVGIPAGSLIGPMTNYYYFVGIILMITFFLIRMLGKSPFGLALQASRDNYERTEFIGLNVKRHQLVTFTIGAFFAGLAGALFAIMNRAVFPDLLYWTNSGEVLVISLLGGVGTLYGPILGAAILTLLGKYIADYTIYWGFILGIILTIIVIFMPGGITGFVRKQLGGRL